MFLLDLRKPFSESFLNNFEEIFFFYNNMLKEGLEEYKKPILLILHSFLLNVNIKSKYLIDTIFSFLNTNLSKEATKILDVCVRNSSKTFSSVDEKNKNYENEIYYKNFENSSKGNQENIFIIESVK
jgi:hypothetical protein